MKLSVAFALSSVLMLSACRFEREDFAAGLSHYQQNELTQARSIFERLAREDSSNTQVLSYLAETYRRTGETGRAIATARRALRLDGCDAFAHCVLAEAMNPLVEQTPEAHADSTWVHLLKAAACDSANGTPWLMIWGESIHRGDPHMTARAARRMIETGFFAEALLSYTRWVLHSMPPKAILLTNGDMDTYPVAALQEAEHLRTDVALVNRGTLNEPWHARYVRDVEGVRLPLTDAALDSLRPRKDASGVTRSRADQIIAGWIAMLKAGTLERPLVFANTIEETTMDRFASPLQYCGAYTAVRTEEVDRPDVQAIRTGLLPYHPEDFFGPWVSDQDRSPVRRMGTKHLVGNVTHAALTLAEQAALRGDADAFARWIDFARELDNGSERGPVYTARIEQLEQRGVPPR